MRSLTRITPLVFRNVRRRTGKRPIQFAILTFILLVSVGNIIGPASARVQTVRFIVSFKPQVGQIERTQTMNMAGGHVTSQLGIINGAVAEIPLRQVEELRRNPDVASVEEDAPVTASDLSADIQILANLTWAIETNGTGARLATPAPAPSPPTPPPRRRTPPSPTAPPPNPPPAPPHRPAPPPAALPRPARPAPRARRR